MRTIWKYELEVTDYQEVMIPADAELLSVGNQNGSLCLWAMVDTAKQKMPYYIEIFGTGNPICLDMGIDRKFIGTVIAERFVWHVFERL